VIHNLHCGDHQISRSKSVLWTVNGIPPSARALDTTSSSYDGLHYNS
jgi:hypothetical protein